jgi:hypothetical protein
MNAEKSYNEEIKEEKPPLSVPDNNGIINNYFQNTQSSCYFLDLRGSTKFIRQISLKIDKNDQDSIPRLKQHADFMAKIHSELEKKLSKINIKDFYYNDTGDGHMCLFWGNSHSWIALYVACHMYSFLTRELPPHNNLIKNWFPELELKFGIGLHSGGSIILKNRIFGRDYAYGIAINSASRMEGFNKNFKNINFLLSGNFHEFLEKHFKNVKINGITNFSELNKNISRVTKEKVDIKDDKPDGHYLWTVRDPDFFDGKIRIK